MTTDSTVVWTSCQTPDGRQAVTRQTVRDVQFFILEAWGWVRACPHAEKQFRLSHWQHGCRLPNVAEIKQ